MRLAIVSDIHANIEALEAVVDDITAQKVDETACLGDLVGYGASPNECVALVKQHCPISLLGNHDAAALGALSTENFNIHARIAIEWTTENLSAESRSYLTALPLRENRLSASLVHSTPYEPNMWHYITSLEEAAYNFQFFETPFCFVGHTHIPLIITVSGAKEISVYQDTKLSYGSLAESRFLINVGSVGQPRDRDSRACYGILDTDAQTFVYRRVKYDIGACQDKMKKIGLPEFLISRLKEGK